MNDDRHEWHQEHENRQRRVDGKKLIHREAGRTDKEARRDLRCEAEDTSNGACGRLAEKRFFRRGVDAKG